MIIPITELTGMHTIAMTQYNVKKGLQIFGDKGVEAIMSEMKQIDARKVLKPVDPDSLSQYQKQKTLEYLMFLKQKRCGKIKGRGCADGRK